MRKKTRVKIPFGPESGPSADRQAGAFRFFAAILRFAAYDF